MPATHGESLVELLVALVLLEILGAAALATALTVERVGRDARAGSADDQARWQQYRAAETRPACRADALIDTVPVTWPPTPRRESLAAAVRCGP